jgi:hypothetical protein
VSEELSRHGKIRPPWTFLAIQEMPPSCPVPRHEIDASTLLRWGRCRSPWDSLVSRHPAPTDWQRIFERLQAIEEQSILDYERHLALVERSLDAMEAAYIRMERSAKFLQDTQE